MIALVTLSVVLACLSVCPAFAGDANPPAAKSKQQGETKGMVSFGSRDEIIGRAKKEGKLRLLVNMDAPTLKAAAKVFTQKYPFLDVSGREITGSAMIQRNVLEIKSGQATREWDVVYTSRDFYSEYLPYLWQVDLLRMAEQGVLQIPTPMIDPQNRNIAAFYSRLIVNSYNKNLLPPDQVPKAWEDLVKPEFRGKKFALDIGPRWLACMVPAWGLEKTLDFARKLAAQQPIWVQGVTRTLTSMMAGEVPLMIGTMFHSVKRAQMKDRAGVLQYVTLEPAPVYFHSEQAVLASAQNPHAALLWLEWMASAESQKLADEHEPVGSSRYFRGGAVERELQGKKLSLVTWENHHNIESWMTKVFEAYGFPKAER
jgi:ABC-type Fe3+ transport system substrate-binding protein